jgi:hypothetical protein
MTEPTPDPPAGPTNQPLVVLLRFIEALPASDAFARLDAPQIFEAMRRELPTLSAVDLLFAGAVATQLGKQLRSLDWALRKLPGKPSGKKIRVQPRKDETLEQAVARYEGKYGVSSIRSKFGVSYVRR